MSATMMTLDPLPYAGCDTQLATLSSTLGTPFQLWSETSPADVHEFPFAQSEDAAKAIANAHRLGCGKLILNDGNLAVWLRLPGTRSGPALAFGRLSYREPTLTNLLIQAARKLIEQQAALSDQSADLESCLESLTYGLEEQNWLRTLSNHLTLCSIRRSLREVAAELIPSLRRLVEAESIGILLTNAEAPLEIGAVPSADHIEQILWNGPMTVEESVWRAWYLDQSTMLQSQPLVQNGARVDVRLRGCAIHSFCAVQIVRGNKLYGWIVATDRFANHRSGFSNLPHGMSESEFGTVEAGLIEAAAKMLATHGHNVELLRDRENLAIGVIRAMGYAVDARDPYTRGHSERVGRFGRLLARAIGLPNGECDRIYLSGLLHDVGKIGIPDAVLGKPGKLTDDEFAVVKRHPEIGARIVQAMPQLADLLPGILHHHESINGNGYPHGLAGDAIPLMARILAVSDAYDAMTSNRPYRRGMPHCRAVEVLSCNAGVQWDEQLVRAFLSIPEQTLLLDAVGTEQGWQTDEHSLRGGTAALFDHHTSLTITSEIVDDAIPAELLVALK